VPRDRGHIKCPDRDGDVAAGQSAAGDADDVRNSRDRGDGGMGERQPMNCSEIQDVATLWLSGELEEARSSQVRAHLEGCAGCARAMAEDASLDVRIRKALGEEEPATQQIEGMVLRRIASERRRRWLLAGGIAAAVLLSLVFGAPLFVKQQQPRKLFMDAARDHRLEVMEHQPRRWRSEPGEVAVVAERFGLTGATALAMAPAGYRLVHAKTCGLEGRPALHLVYTDGAREISLYVRRETDGLQRTGSTEIGGERMAWAERAGYSAVAVTTGEPDECRQIAQRAVSIL
jgi:anti-sigma factor RsiW